MSDLIKINKKELQSHLKDSYDIFICSSSFDDRCLSIPKIVSNKSFSRIIISHFENNYESANINFENLKSFFVTNKSILSALLLKKHEPIYNYDKFYSIFDDLKQSPNANILVDISTFTREYLLILIRFIKYNLPTSISVTLCYSPSSAYPNWLSKGVKQIRSILGYSGDFSSLKKLLLIVMVGFEYERSQTVIENYEPIKLLIGKAAPKNSISTDLSIINDNHYENLIKRNPQAGVFEFSCIDIEKTKAIILSFAKEYEHDYNIIVAPMNNKISTLGVAYAALENPTIQICYASTNQYNIDEKHGESEYAYCFELFDGLNTYPSNIK